jgi:hypothetical protein
MCESAAIPGSPRISPSHTRHGGTPSRSRRARHDFPRARRSCADARTLLWTKSPHIKNETPKMALGDSGPKWHLHRHFPHTKTKPYLRNAAFPRRFERHSHVVDGGAEDDGATAAGRAKERQRHEAGAARHRWRAGAGTRAGNRDSYVSRTYLKIADCCRSDINVE